MKRTTVPLQLIDLHDNGFHLLVEVVVFGGTFYAVLDTGASKTVLDKATVEEFVSPEGLVTSDKLSTGLGTNSMESHTVLLSQLKIGRLKLQNFEVAVLDLSTISAAYQTMELPPVIGVIGGDILKAHEAVIDYKNLHLKLSANSCI